MYYPLSQITPNLYTNGNEYALNPNDPSTIYSGYYWKSSEGKFFTGKTPQDINVQQLYPILSIDLTNYPNISTNFSYNSIELNSKDIFGESTTEGFNINLNNYIYLKNINPSTIQLIPTYSPQLPTQQDYQIGEFRRYFCKKTNEIIYVEINKDQYDKLIAKDPQILWQLYLPFFIDWQLTGDKQQVAKVNRNIVLLKSKNLKLPAFSLYLKEDYTKYYQ